MLGISKREIYTSCWDLQETLSDSEVLAPSMNILHYIACVPSS